MFKMHYTIVVLTVILLIGPLTANNNLQSAIGFPEVEEDPYRKNKDERQPVYIPSACGVNELFYPGDQADDWVCDCMPAHLYHPLSDTCWPAYQKGPCQSGEHLILPKDTVIPICVKNACNDGQVLLKGKCERLGSTIACSFLYPVPAAVGVNATTLEVGCERISLGTRIDAPPTETSCQPGTKRYVNGKCDKIKK